MKSLEIVNILLEDVKIKNKYVFERVYNAPIATSDLQQIKQDLEKYNKVMKLLKNLFKEIKLEQEDWDGCSIFYMEDIKFDTFEISNELFSILDDLKILVGDRQ